MGDFLIERATEEILGEVAELEELCFSFPWSKKSLKLLCSDKNVAFVAKDVNSGKVVAYGGMVTVLDEGQITNIATHQSFRRRGLGLKIVSALIDYARENEIVSISLEVRESNLAAIELYKRLGFVEAGIRKNFYASPVEDGIVMTLGVGEIS